MTGTRASAGRLLALRFCHIAFKVLLSTAAIACDQSGVKAMTTEKF